MPISNKETRDLRAILRRVGYKATASRLAILSAIKQSKNPVSAQELIEKLGGKYDQATVYRFIKRLKDGGIIRQIDLRQNHARYELFDTEDHHHLVCVDCGKIEDIAGCDIEDMHKAILGSTKNFSEIRQHSLEFYGVCKNCIKHQKVDKLV